MQLKDLDIDPQVVSVLEQEGISELYPPQAEALPATLEGKNVVLAIPTASGKSLVAYLAILKKVLEHGKALYIVPLRALAREKYDDLKRFEALGINVGLSVGDYDSKGEELEKFDILIATSEKADSLLRHRTHWLNRISIIIADEIHLINDPSRGPTLEVILALFKQINPGAQVIALSATINNSIDLALWLNAEHFTSEWRPVPLKEGVYFDKNIYFGDNSVLPLESGGDAISVIVNDILKAKSQCLIFVNTRRSAENLGENLGDLIAPTLTDTELGKLVKTSEKLRTAQLEITTIISRLKDMVKKGGAFHHAGLTNEHRKIIEENFRNGLIKVLVATPTLAAGINLPARRVIVRDLGRYDANLGYRPIPVLEIKQMFGRAGRPKYDTQGEAIAIAKGESDKRKIMERYILGEPERIYSKLGLESALRMNILSTIASEFVFDDESLQAFIDNTFFAYQGDTWALDAQLEMVKNFLEQEEFIVITDNKIEATEYGRRVSRLYIDPISAVRMRRALEAADANPDYLTPISYLHTIAGTADMMQLYLREADYKWLEPLAQEHEKELLIKPSPHEADYESFLSEFKTAWLLWDWISERSEERISLTYNIGPGDIRNRVDTSQWLMYALGELARMFNFRDFSRDLIRLNLRIRYGVKEELLPLVSLRGIGRVRARNLFRSNLRSLDDLRDVDLKKISAVPTIGKLVALSIKEQLGDESARKFIEKEKSDVIEEALDSGPSGTLDQWNDDS
ncbi:MAG: DEAD/DEAH box helicase [Thermoplasmata archaeon]|nr:MAG: DEAD/DEAH box helicase [Thermoplasmata archaeon]